MSQPISDDAKEKGLFLSPVSKDLNGSTHETSARLPDKILVETPTQFISASRVRSS